TKGAFTKRWAIALRWWCGGKAPPARLTNRLWTCRFAWTTQERCPHAHSHNNNRMLSQLETGETSGRVQLRTGLKWSRSWGPLQNNAARYGGLDSQIPLIDLRVGWLFGHSCCSSLR